MRTVSKNHGYEGRKALMNEIGTLAVHVDRIWQEVQMQNQKAQCGSDVAGS